MSWYWIIAICLAYFAIWILFALWVKKSWVTDAELATFFASLWPVSLPIFCALRIVEILTGEKD